MNIVMFISVDLIHIRNEMVEKKVFCLQSTEQVYIVFQAFVLSDARRLHMQTKTQRVCLASTAVNPDACLAFFHHRVSECGSSANTNCRLKLKLDCFLLIPPPPPPD